MIVALLVACNAGPAPELRRELWRGPVDGDNVYITAVLEDDVVTGFEPEGTSARWTLRVVVDAPWVVYALPPVQTSDAGAARPLNLDTLPFVACPLPHGLAFRVDEVWFAAWRVSGGTIATALPDVAGATCPELKYDAMAIAQGAQDQRWCRLLDDAGDLAASARCVIAVDSRPGGGPWNPDLKVRYQTDPRRQSALANAAVDAILTPGAILTALPAIHHVGIADDVARVLAERCAATPCDPVAVGMGERIIATVPQASLTAP